MLFDQYLAFKIMSGVILFTGAIIFSLIPLALAALRNKFIKEEFIVQILDIINGFGGGALLSSGFLHLLPESHEILTEAISALQGTNTETGSGSNGGHNHDIMAVGHDHENKVYPYAFLVASLAIVFFYHLEKIIEILILALKSMTSTSIKKETETTFVEPEVELQQQETFVDIENKIQEVQEDEVISNVGTESCSEILQEEKKTNFQEKESTVHHRGHKHKVHHDEEHDHNHGDHEHSHIDADILNSSSKVRAAVGGFILWLSLVSHSVFDGLAIGILSDFKLWSLFITILSHHFIAAIALGTVLRKGVSNIFVSGFFIISFAATIPVGVVIGIIVSTIQGQAFEIIHGISLAFTGGAFIYVASFEIMGHSRTKSKIVFALRTLMFMLGFAAMAVIANFG